MEDPLDPRQGFGSQAGSPPVPLPGVTSKQASLLAAEGKGHWEWICRALIERSLHAERSWPCSRTPGH